jgi:hypothetical protein
MLASGRKSEGKEAKGEGISGELLAAKGAIEERSSRAKKAAFQQLAGSKESLYGRGREKGNG